MTDDDAKTYGQIAYEAWAQSSHSPVPWSALGAEGHATWHTAALAVRMALEEWIDLNSQRKSEMLSRVLPALRETHPKLADEVVELLVRTQ